jgi:hypothetical protein
MFNKLLIVAAFLSVALFAPFLSMVASADEFTPNYLPDTITDGSNANSLNRFNQINESLSDQMNTIGNLERDLGQEFDTQLKNEEYRALEETYKQETIKKNMKTNKVFKDACADPEKSKNFPDLCLMAKSSCKYGPKKCLCEEVTRPNTGKFGENIWANPAYDTVTRVDTTVIKSGFPMETSTYTDAKYATPPAGAVNVSGKKSDCIDREITNMKSRNEIQDYAKDVYINEGINEFLEEAYSPTIPNPWITN